MNIVIIEDEVQIAWDLQNSIETLRPDFLIKAVLDSVESSLDWLSHNKQPDLIFSDIQLGDGLAFDIFRKVEIKCPVVFCTAYDAYAIQAFQNNGIDYLLKPVNESLLEKSLAKIDLLKQTVAEKYEFTLLNNLLKEIELNTRNYKTTFLVSYREKMLPISIADVAFFCISNEATQLYTKDNRQYQLNYSLDNLESAVDPKLFYRANRQYLVGYNAIKEIEHYFDRKLLVKLIHSNMDPVIVSKAKASDFLKWVESR